MPAKNPPHNANVHGTPSVLMVNSKYDPESSYVWANGLLNQIDNAVLLTRNGNGRTSHALNGTTAAAIDVYLVSGTMPAANTVCET